MNGNFNGTVLWVGPGVAKMVKYHFISITKSISKIQKLKYKSINICIMQYKSFLK